MASISTDPAGKKRILFVAPDGSRKTVRVGNLSQRAAEGIALRVDDLLACKIHGQVVSRDTAAWLRTGIGDKLHDRLARAGLVEPRQKADTVCLGAFIASYIAGRVDLKPSTLAVIRQAEKSLVSHFGADRALDAITPGDADGWRLAMLGENLAEATIRKRSRMAKQICNAAIRRRIIAENPFTDLPSANRPTPPVCGSSTSRRSSGSWKPARMPSGV